MSNKAILENASSGSTEALADKNLCCGLSSLAELADAPWHSTIPHEDLSEMQRWAQLSRRLQVAPPARGALPASPDSTLLTERELEGLGRIADGESNKLIARSLDLSPHTVKRHVARILDRLNLGSRGEAAAWYHRQQRAGRPVSGDASRHE